MTEREGSEGEGWLGKFMREAMEPSRLARSSASGVRMAVAWRAAARSSAEFLGVLEALLSLKVSEMSLRAASGLGVEVEVGGGGGSEGSCGGVAVGVGSSGKGREEVVVKYRRVGLRGWEWRDGDGRW